MYTTKVEQRIFQDYIFDSIEAFLIDRQAQGLSKSTLGFYKYKLKEFLNYCDTKAVKNVSQLTPTFLREYLLLLEEAGHKPGGIHAFYRCIKAFLLWYENEFEPDNWKNPIRKIKAPRVPEEILEPVKIDVVNQMLEACTNLRDKTILFMLMDTGVRASELLNLNVADVNSFTGDVMIRKGKGGKSRIVFLGAKTRKVLRKYLHTRTDNSGCLFINRDGERLQYRGLKMVMKRLADRAGVAIPSIHSFRRFFAITCLRNHVDVYTLQRLMGHADLSVLHRYLKQTDEDLRIAFRSPVDNL
jgi:integrase/recombinase XerD